VLTNVYHTQITNPNHSRY